ncbi:MAG: hypothetical protein ACRCXE_00985 [Metamycoplasmataceae bacterium]
MGAYLIDVVLNYILILSYYTHILGAYLIDVVLNFLSFHKIYL